MSHSNGTGPTPAASAKRRRGCYCHHCKKEGFKRSELSDSLCPKGKYLCSDCVQKPDARGLKDYECGRNRGLAGGRSVPYWANTLKQLRAVTDENPDGLTNAELTAQGRPMFGVGNDNDLSKTAAPPQATVQREKKAAKKKREKTEVQLWATDVRAATDLPLDEKYFVISVRDEFADFKTGGNCFPTRREIAAKLGLTDKQVRRLLASVAAKGWWKLHAMVIGRPARRTSSLIQFLRPASATHGPWEGPIDYSHRQGARLLTQGKSYECPGSL